MSFSEVTAQHRKDVALAKRMKAESTRVFSFAEKIYYGVVAFIMISGAIFGLIAFAWAFYQIFAQGAFEP